MVAQAGVEWMNKSSWYLHAFDVCRECCFRADLMGILAALEAVFSFFLSVNRATGRFSCLKPASFAIHSTHLQ